MTPDNQYRPDIAYAPPGECRLIDMYSTYNSNKIDLAVYWKDVFGNLNPLLPAAGLLGARQADAPPEACLSGLKKRYRF